MRKLVVLGVLLSILCAWPTAAKADNWGVGVKVGVGENDPKTMKEIQDGTLYNTELNENGAVFSGLEALYEFNLDDETNKLGVKLGVDVFGHNDLKVTTPLAWVKWTETTYAIPLTVYYKRDNGVSAWAPYVGAGVSFFRSELKVEFSGDDWAWKPNTILGQKLKKTERSIPIIRV
jgi:outer membrane protein W